MEFAHPPAAASQEASTAEELTAAGNASSLNATVSEQQVMEQSGHKKQPSGEALIADIANRLIAAQGEGSSDLELPLSVPKDGDFLLQIADALSAKSQSGDDTIGETGVDEGRLTELLSNSTIRSRLRLVGRAFLEVSKQQDSALLSQPGSSTNSSADQGVYLNVYDPLSTGEAPATSYIGSAIDTSSHATSNDSDGGHKDEINSRDGAALFE